MKYKITIDPAVLEIEIEAVSWEHAEQEAMSIVLQHWEITKEDEEIEDEEIL